MSRRHRIVVVGASLAGIRTAQALRENGFDGQLTIIGAEAHIPYDRPPLSKGVLAGVTEVAEIMVLTERELTNLDISLRLGRRAIALDTTDRIVSLDDGTNVQYDQLVIATGATAHLPRTWGGMEGVHVLRTLDDCLALRAELKRSPRVVVVGGGFIGCEVAATARKLGLEVSLVEPLVAPLARALGDEMALACAEIHRDAGVKLYCGQAVDTLVGAERVERVRLTNGESIEADVVVVGIGAHPETSWLEGSKLAVNDGVLCDSRCETSVPGVFAAGDVARWVNVRFGHSMRVEHWTNACEQGAFVAKALLDDTKTQSFSPVPFVWSEQHGARIEIAGAPRPGDQVRVIERDESQRTLLAHYERDGRLTGALAINATRGLLRIRRFLSEQGPIGSPEMRTQVFVPNSTEVEGLS